jgi:parvulin-like peptidyl-prolyl isomerase
MRTTLLLCLVIASVACREVNGEPENDSDSNLPVAADSGNALEALRANVAATAGRAEHSADQVTVEHILVSFRGATPAATRSQAEAEVLAAELLARIEAGEDFSALRKSYSDDPGGGTYTMLASGPGNNRTTFARRGMVPAFGDVGWRLEVDQVGVACHDGAKSPFGWHIIKRRE